MKKEIIMKKDLFYRLYMCFLHFVFCFAPFSLAAQTYLNLVCYDNTEQTFRIDTAGRLYFQTTNLMIDEGDGTPKSIELATVRKITIQQIATGISQTEQTVEMFIYPNPAQNFIRIANSSSEKMTISIYSLSGKLMQSGEFSSDDEINVSNLPSGLYLLKANNKILKISKL